MNRKFIETQVFDIKDLSPHMRRIVFSGESLKQFPENYESAHVKLLVLEPNEDASDLTPGPDLKKRMRSYTVRKFDVENQQLTVDISVNKHKGVITDWAIKAKLGERIAVGGPGPIKYKDLHADWHLLAGDITGLPVIAATIEKLPADAIGHVFLQIPSEADKQDINAPQNVHIKWIVNEDLGYNALIEHIANLKWAEGIPHILIAGEGSQIKDINNLLKENPQYDKEKVYASGYWNK